MISILAVSVRSVQFQHRNRHPDFVGGSDLTFYCFRREQIGASDIWKRRTYRTNEGPPSPRNEDGTYQDPSVHMEIVPRWTAVQAAG